VVQRARHASYKIDFEMRLRKHWPIFLITILLFASVVGYYFTRETSSPGAGTVPSVEQSQKPLVDDSLLATARGLSALADTAGEQELARGALRLADHELDQAFSTALRQAAAAPPPANGPLQKLNARITRLKARLHSYEARISQLTKQSEVDKGVTGELAVLKAQYALDEDALQDAQEDLVRQGDRYAVLEQMLQQREALQHEPGTDPKPATPAVATALVQRARLWMGLNDRVRQLRVARKQASDHAAGLVREHDSLEAQGPQTTGSSTAAEANVTQAAVDQLQLLSEHRKTLAQYGHRIRDSQQLADIYGRWTGVVESRMLTVLHLLTGSFILIAAILLGVIGIDRAIGRAFRQTDRRRLHQLRTIARLAIQVTGVVLILVILFGSPTQVTTLIGLATAGLTVALKDFIIGFFGWFVLLGRNGLHIGDWVEIEGVAGEVIEIGLLKTVLLEVGNGSVIGHPTGRRVSFVNSFAIEGHFFNFTTAGQWLWDELVVTIPAKGDPYQTAEKIAAVVAGETEAEVHQAEQDWKRVTAQYGVREFSARPAVSLRPGPMGLEAVIRYITRAHLRYQVKSRLFQLIVSQLQELTSVSAG
jgi:small-conductance mechanosensitive channel